ncbi:hypothetical protein GCM10023187_12790 [Nibrella viscosa]|uniref:Uncharacterized protein n=2 Tax=Nibrella viscosa TaxID=1084524 RepID=A0ABP8K4Q9_9BACT
MYLCYTVKEIRYMAFYHFHHNKARHVKIHHGDCPECNEGKGKQTRSGRGTTTGNWSPPFNSYLKAYQDANTLARQLSVRVEDHDCIEKMRAEKSLGAIEKTAEEPVNS